MTLVTEQVRFSVPDIWASGAAPSIVTMVVANAVQPLAPVTVTVYVPAAVIVASAVLAEKEFGPDQL